MGMTRAMASRWSTVFAFAATLVGCTSPGEGELGEGEFVYQCVGSADFACSGGDAEFPRAVAVGGKFDMRFEIYDDRPTPVVTSAVPAAVKEEGGAFRVVRPGYALMLAVNGEGAVIDLKHMFALAADSLQVYRDGPVDSTLELEVGEEFSLRTAAYAGQEELAGAVEYTWDAADTDVLSVTSATATPEQATIRALRAGDTSLTVSGAGATREIEVHVVDANESIDAGGTEPDAGSPQDGGV